MIRDDAALQLARNILSTVSNDSSAVLVQLTASYIQRCVANDELAAQVERKTSVATLLRLVKTGGGRE